MNDAGATRTSSLGTSRSRSPRAAPTNENSGEPGAAWHQSSGARGASDTETQNKDRRAALQAPKPQDLRDALQTPKPKTRTAARRFRHRNPKTCATRFRHRNPKTCATRFRHRNPKHGPARRASDTETQTRESEPKRSKSETNTQIPTRQHRTAAVFSLCSNVDRSAPTECHRRFVLQSALSMASAIGETTASLHDARRLRVPHAPPALRNPCVSSRLNSTPRSRS